MQLAIRLTEPVVFLRGDHSNPRRALLVNSDADSTPPAMVRGLIVLSLDKPTKISTIEVEIEGKCTSEWPEGMGARRVEVFEEHRILYAKATFFNAAEEEKERLRLSRQETRAGASVHPRRHASVGPGVAFDRGMAHGFDFEASDDDDSGDEGRGRNRDIADSRAKALAKLERPVLERHNSVDPYQQSHYPTIPNYRSDGPAIPPPLEDILPTREELEERRRDSETNANTRANAQSPIGSPASRPQQLNPQSPLSLSRTLTPTLPLTPTQSRTYTHAHVSNPGSPHLADFPSHLSAVPPPGGPVPLYSSPLASPPLNVDGVGAVPSQTSSSQTSYFQDHQFPSHPNSTSSIPSLGRVSSHTLSHSHSHSPLASQVQVGNGNGTTSSRPPSMLPGSEQSNGVSSGQSHAQFHSNVALNWNGTDGDRSAPSNSARSESKSRSKARFSLIPGIALSTTKEKEKERGRDRTTRADDSAKYQYPPRTATVSEDRGIGGDSGKGKKKSTFEKIGERLKASVVGVSGSNSPDGAEAGGSGHVKHW